MKLIHEDYPYYGWNRNKGYPTKSHCNAVIKYGLSKWHRRSFQIKRQLRLDL